MHAIPAAEKAIIRELAKQVAELAAQPAMDEYRRLWRKLNGLSPERPMVVADQICWNEMDVDGELTLRCLHPDCQAYERDLRRSVYRRRHMPDDMVIEPFVRVPKAITGVTLGMRAQVDILATDSANDVVSQHYENQITCMDDVSKVVMPVIGHDAAETARRMNVAHDLFDGILGVREEGYNPYLSVWDPIATWMGVENAMFMMMDEPEVIHALVGRVVAAYMSMLDQMEEQGLLCCPQPLIHCTGAFTDELPPPDYDPLKPRTKDIWMFGLAQMLGACSPAMYNEFEIEPCLPLFERFGLVYYGCCDPLDGRIDFLRKVKNIRKLSVSPWANEARLAEEIGRGWVFSRKPNPALLAFDTFDEALIRDDLTRTRDLCARHGCPLELIQKDISTVRYAPQRLWAWVRIAKEIAGG